MGEDKGNLPTPSHVEPLLEPLKALQSLMKQFGKPGVVIGGIAASLLGKPRFTADLDAVILMSVDQLSELLETAEHHGIVPRIDNAIEFARKNRVVLLRHLSSSINVDISLGILPFEVELVERSQVLSVGGLDLRLPSPEDLIIMKAVANRSKDQDDIEAIAVSHENLDMKRIQFWVEQFGEVLENPDLWKEIQQLL